MADAERPALPAYREEDMRILDLAFVRQHPGMYIGNAQTQGLHCMLLRLVTNSLSEAVAGFGRHVRVMIDVDGSATVADDGRAAPNIPDFRGESGLAETLTRLHRNSEGREWFDYAVANALSEWFHVETLHDGQVFRQEFRRGEPVASPRRLGATSSSGLRVTFLPDPELFEQFRLDAEIIRERLRQDAYLHSGVRLSFSDRRDGTEETFEFADGIAVYVRSLSWEENPLHEVLVCRGEGEGVRYEIGLQWCAGSGLFYLSCVNGEVLREGGVDRAGLKTAVTRSLNNFIRERMPGMRVLKGEEAWGGLIAVASLRLAEPIFVSAIRSRLDNAEAERAVEAGVGRFLRAYFEANPAVAEQIVTRAINEALAFQASRSEANNGS